MDDTVVFDTSAFLTLTGDEPGADQVQAHVTDGIAGRILLHATFVSLTEVEYVTLLLAGVALKPEPAMVTVEPMLPLSGFTELTTGWLHAVQVARATQSRTVANLTHWPTPALDSAIETTAAVACALGELRPDTSHSLETPDSVFSNASCPLTPCPTAIELRNETEDWVGITPSLP